MSFVVGIQSEHGFMTKNTRPIFEIFQTVQQLSTGFAQRFCIRDIKYLSFSIKQLRNVQNHLWQNTALNKFIVN